jgi:hypothetical protein
VLSNLLLSGVRNGCQSLRSLQFKIFKSDISNHHFVPEWLTSSTLIIKAGCGSFVTGFMHCDNKVINVRSIIFSKKINENISGLKI